MREVHWPCPAAHGSRRTMEANAMLGTPGPGPAGPSARLTELPQRWGLLFGAGLWAQMAPQAARGLITLRPYSGEQTVSQGTLSPEWLFSGDVCCCLGGHVERSMAGRPDTALGVSPSPELHLNSQRRACRLSRWGRAPRGPGLTLYTGTLP